MEKKQKTLLSLGAMGLAALCGLVAFFLIFAHALEYTFFTSCKQATGLQAALGYKIDSIVVFRASPGLILAYVFPLVATFSIGVGSAFSKKVKKYTTLLATLLLLVGGILAFCAPSLASANSTLLSVKIAGGAIASGIVSIIGAIAATTTFFLKD